MSETRPKYVIQLLDNSKFCIGVTAAEPGRQLILSYLTGDNPLTHWYLDPNSGTIESVADPTLVIDIAGNVPGNGTPIILAPIEVGRSYQHWNWVGNPPYIMNVGAPTFCVDNSNAIEKPGNPIWLWTQTPGNYAQQWLLISLAQLEASLLQTAGAKTK